jgi:glycerol kinase
VREREVEATAKGAAEIAAIHLGWFTVKDVEQFSQTDRVFFPDENQQVDIEHFRWWKKALRRSRQWLDPSDLDMP